VEDSQWEAHPQDNSYTKYGAILLIFHIINLYWVVFQKEIVPVITQLDVADIEHDGHSDQQKEYLE